MLAAVPMRTSCHIDAPLGAFGAELIDFAGYVAQAGI
jgi:hypothetical protein